MRWLEVYDWCEPPFDVDHHLPPTSNLQKKITHFFFLLENNHGPRHV